MDTQLRNLLHDLATEMPVDVEGSAPRTLRKARGRRVLTAGAGVAVVLALVVVSASVLRPGAERHPTPAVTGPDSSFEGLWPETDAEGLAATQTDVDQGHMPFRTTADGTATLLATNLLGWNLADVRAELQQQRDGHAVVLIYNQTLPEDVPPIVVGLRQLGRSGPSGVWSVVGAGNLLVDPIAYDRGSPALVHVSGNVPGPFTGAPAVEVRAFDGPTLEPSLGSARSQLDGEAFALDIEVSPTSDGRATLLISLRDVEGRSLAAGLVSIRTPTGAAPSEPTVNLVGVPPDVALTAQGIYDAALRGDVDALGAFLDPDTFAHDFDTGSDPLPGWREDPSDLGLMVSVLRLRAAEPREIEGYGTLYIWPYLVDANFDALTERERADLAALGYSERDITLMVEGSQGYQGPRLAIDETGLWRSFITVGE
jgi:hypothetical protein